MRVCIYGYRGNMGQRYARIIESLGHSWTGIEVDGVWGPFEPGSADCYLVATPTDTHVEVLRSLKDSGRPILCEKPITKDLAELDSLLWDLKRAGVRVQMVNNYDYMPRYDRDELTNNVTVYDYFKSGGDGLYWDCIQLVHLAEGPIKLANDSPIWTCRINGRALSLGDIDRSYVTMIQRWLMDPQCHYERILAAHAKVVRTMEIQCRES